MKNVYFMSGEAKSKNIDFSLDEIKCMPYSRQKFDFFYYIQFKSITYFLLLLAHGNIFMMMLYNVFFTKTNKFSTAKQFFYQRVPYSRGARDSKIGKKWPESSRILDFILS